MEVLEELLQEVPLPRGPIYVDHFLIAGEDPDISLPCLELDLGLVNMQDSAGEDRAQEPVVGRSIGASELVLETQELSRMDG